MFPIAEEEPSEMGLLEMADFYVKSFLVKSTRNIDSKEAHRKLMLNYREAHPEELSSASFLKLIEAYKAVAPEDPEIYRCGAMHYLANNEAVKVREWCEEGLKYDKENVRILCLIVRSYIAENNKDAAIKALINVDKVATEDEEADELRKMVLR